MRKRPSRFSFVLVWIAVLLLSGCGGQKYEHLRVVWISPSVKHSKPIQDINDRALIRRIAACLPGFDDTSLKGITADPPMYDLQLEFQSATGVKTSVKVYLPRIPIWAGMWKHPSGGQLYYFDERHGPRVVELLLPYLPDKI